ncbi:MAG: FAD-dependent oxidoreductase, partial [Firmicutes bacterium]|nr:FAD-dependent oxidoreductase [Bacillota bacterium]
MKYDIIIVGAGPAGLTAAIYACRASKKVLVLEAKSYGGQIINTPDIENYPVAPHISGFEFATNLYNQAKDLGAEIKFEKVVEIRESGAGEKEVVTGKNTYTAGAVIIATGSESRKLGLAGEDELIGKGISYCATCDGAFFRGKAVAVVGGGNTALEDALYLTDPASKVYLIHRRDEFRGEDKTVGILKERANIEFVYNSRVTGLISGDRLTGIEVTDNDGGKREIAVDGLFVAIGRNPENQNFAKLVNLDEAGYVIAGEDCKTNAPGIFTAGDNRTKEVRQLVTAASDGAIAATAAVKY